LPAWASTTAAASPFGPAPITHALPFIVERSAFLCTHHCRGETVGHSVTLILPSASRCKVGAYNPTNCRRHHIPVCCFSAMVVNQNCQSTARTWVGGWRRNGVPDNRATTTSACSSRCSYGLGRME